MRQKGMQIDLGMKRDWEHQSPWMVTNHRSQLEQLVQKTDNLQVGEAEDVQVTCANLLKAIPIGVTDGSISIWDRALPFKSSTAVSSG